MSYLSSLFKTLRMKNCLKRFASILGSRVSDGWIYDDERLRICVAPDETLVYYPIEGGERKLVFCSAPSDHQAIYREGAWESYFAKLYNATKSTVV